MTNELFHPYLLNVSISKFRGVWCIFLFWFFLKYNFLLANSVVPDQTPRSAASDLGLHCLPMSIKWDARLIWVKNHRTALNSCITVFWTVPLSLLLLPPVFNFQHIGGEFAWDTLFGLSCQGSSCPTCNYTIYVIPAAVAGRAETCKSFSHSATKIPTVHVHHKSPRHLSLPANKSTFPTRCKHNQETWWYAASNPKPVVPITSGHPKSDRR